MRITVISGLLWLTALGCGGGDASGPAADGGPDGGTITADAGGADADPAAPRCEITAPVSGSTNDYDQSVTLVATASDREDGALSGASVVWRTDLAAPPLGSGLSVTGELPMPGVHTITCTATDSDGNTGSDSIELTARSPVPVLNHPGDGEVRAASSSIPFAGDGRDFEDGVLPGAALVWTSSLDGTIGSGKSFNAMLSPGTNVVTLTVTDSDGNTSSKAITLTITP
jgi:hypothetical protein